MYACLNLCVCVCRVVAPFQVKVVTRNDQLTAKATSKESRRQTIANNKKEKELKKGKKGGKKKK